MVDIPAAVGVEVEIEKCQPSLAAGDIPFWSATSDSSLRNHGLEFVSKPIRPRLARAAIAALLGGFVHRYKLDTRPEFSWRTSIHVHLNMQDEKVENVLNMMVLYTLYEDSLFSFIGRERRESNFCVPIQETDYPKYISMVMQGDDTLKNLAGKWQKYAAMNIRPLILNDHAGGSGPGSTGSPGQGKGTLEFRHLEGTYDLSKIINWMNLLLRLQKTSREMSLEELESRVLSLSTRTHYISFLQDTFGPYTGLLPVKDWEVIKYNSVACAKECFHPMPALKPLLKATQGKATGISEMLKLRSRAKEEVLKKRLMK